jgi:excisionase family DNA binding protein
VGYSDDFIFSEIEDRGVTMAEACEILGYSRWTINAMIRKGELTAYGTHKRKRIHLSTILQYQQSSSAAGCSKTQTAQEIRKFSKRYRDAAKRLEERLK